MWHSALLGIVCLLGLLVCSSPVAAQLTEEQLRIFGFDKPEPDPHAGCSAVPPGCAVGESRSEGTRFYVNVTNNCGTPIMAKVCFEHAREIFRNEKVSCRLAAIGTGGKSEVWVWNSQHPTGQFDIKAVGSLSGDYWCGDIIPGWNDTPF